LIRHITYNFNMQNHVQITLLQDAGIHHHDADIRTMSAEELITHFGSRDTGKVVTARLIKNIIYQVWQNIRAGREPEIQGNVRTFWYRHVKPAWSRIPVRHRQRKAPARATSRLLAELIEGLRLFDYADFGFTDENWRNRGIGIARPQVLLFAEKAGQIRLLLRLHKRLGVSFLALGGMPSACTSEFTARQVRAAVDLAGFSRRKTIHLVGIVDHDPAGRLIAQTFADQLQSFDLGPLELHLVLGPEHFTRRQLAAGRLPLKDDARTRRWLAEGGGIDGEPWALSVEALPVEKLERITRRVIREVAPRPVQRSRAGVPVHDPRWQRALDGPGGAAKVVVLRPEDLGDEVAARMAEGYRLVVVDDGQIVGVLGQGAAETRRAPVADS